MCLIEQKDDDAYNLAASILKNWNAKDNKPKKFLLDFYDLFKTVFYVILLHQHLKVKKLKLFLTNVLII